ncbi:MAG: endonuclease domain-containing protein [Oscillospiraceae bacterium]|nr:endonuclease domain-containing protein [Oscillospiraceae bacterium]
MERKHNKNIVPNAKNLRKNMTKEERHLWYDFLRDYPIKFLRQKILGNYIVDFYCASAKLVIELDGSQHYEDTNKEKDSERSDFLKGYDITVIRIPNNEVNRNFDSVCTYIDTEVKKSLGALQKN